MPRKNCHPRHVYLTTDDDHALALRVGEALEISQQQLFLALFLDRKDELRKLAIMTDTPRPAWIEAGIIANSLTRSGKGKRNANN